MKNIVMHMLVIVLSMTNLSLATIVFDSDFETDWAGWTPGGNIQPVRTTDFALTGDYAVKYNVSNAGIKSHLSRGISGSPGEYWFRFMYRLDQATAYTNTTKALNLLDFRPSGAGPLWRLKFSGTNTGLSNAYLNITPESAQMPGADTTPISTTISADDWVGDNLWHQIIIHVVHDIAANGGGVWMWVDPEGANPSATVGRSDNWTANNPLGTIYTGDLSSLSDVQMAYFDRIAFGDTNESLSSIRLSFPALMFDSDFETDWDGWTPGGNIYPLRTTDFAFTGDYAVKYNVSNAGIKSHLSRGISGSPGEYWFRFMYQLDQAAAYTNTTRALNLLDFRPSGAGPLWRLKFSGTNTGLSNAYLNITPESAQMPGADTTPISTTISADDWVGDNLWHQIIIHVVHDIAANGGGVWMWVDPEGANPSATVGRSDNWTANNPLGTIYTGDLSSLSDVQMAYFDRIAFGDWNGSLSSIQIIPVGTLMIIQ